MSKPAVVQQLSDMSIDEISLVDRAANQHATITFAKRNVGTRERKRLAAGNKALPDGSFPMRTRTDVANAGRALGRTSPAKRTQVKSLISERKRALGMSKAAKDDTAARTFTSSADPSGIRDGDEQEKNVGPGKRISGTQKTKGKTVPPDSAGSPGAPGSEMGPQDSLNKPVGKNIEYWKSVIGKALDMVVEEDDDDLDSYEDDYEPNTDELAEIEDDDSEGEDVVEKGFPAGIGRAATKAKSGLTQQIAQHPKIAAGAAGFGAAEGMYQAGKKKGLFQKSTDISKHLPGQPGFSPNGPQQSPFPGAPGAGQPPMMQTPGVQPMGVGQPQMPMGHGQPQMGQPAMGGQHPQPGMGMGQQLPPDVVAYIQQLEQALAEAKGEDSSEGSDSTSASSSSDKDTQGKKNNPFGKSEGYDMNDDEFLTELSKSLESEEQRVAISKAMEAVSKAEQRAVQAEEIAKAERDLRLEREYIEQASQLALPVAPEELGPVLKRMAEALTTPDFEVIAKCLNGSSEMHQEYFTEIGKRGGGANSSVLDEVNMRAAEIAKSAGSSFEAAEVEVFANNPRAYEEYMADHPSRRSFG